MRERAREVIDKFLRGGYQFPLSLVDGNKKQLYDNCGHLIYAADEWYDVEMFCLTVYVETKYYKGGYNVN